MHILYSLGRIKEKGFTQRVEKNANVKRGKDIFNMAKNWMIRGVNRENNEILILFF